GPNFDKDGNIEQRQMAQAKDRIPPMQVANLPPTAATPGPFKATLDADELVPLLGPLCGEDANIGQVQRNLNEVIQSNSHREPGPRSSHNGAPSLHDTCSPSRQFRENRDYTTRLQDLCNELGVADRIRFLGHREDVPDLLRAADIFFLPSTSEGLPLSVLEAQATKVPVLAAATAGIPEVITDGETAFLIPA